MSEDHCPEVDPRRRKRERDKQNQRRKRRKEKETLLELEQRNASLEREVKALYDGASGSVQSLSDTVQFLRLQNQILSERLTRVNEFVKSWNDGDISSLSSPQNDLEQRQVSSEEKTTIDGRSSAALFVTGMEGVLPGADTSTAGIAAESTFSGINYGNMNVPTIGVGVDSTNMQVTEPGRLKVVTSPSARSLELEGRHYGLAFAVTPQNLSDVHQPRVLGQPDILSSSKSHPGPSEMIISLTRFENLLALQPWERLPVNISVHKCFDPFGTVIRDMRRSMEQFKLCDPEPKVLDLIYGGSLNELANAVFQSTAETPFRRTEKVAGNFCSYMVARWLIEPSEESYNRLPLMLRPTALQLTVPHPPIFDYIVSPTMRDNFIKHGLKYCRSEIIGLLFCTSRIRDTLNSDFVIRTKGQDLQLDPDFRKKISTVDNWVLLDRFWKEYPELVDGIDSSTYMISEKDLI